MTEKPKTLKVAAVQILSFEGEGDRNVERMVARIDEAAQAGARLIVFPEASNNGYFFEDRDHAHKLATPVPGPFTDAIGNSAKKWGVWVVTGLFERGEGNDVFNAAVLIGPDGLVAGKYQKNFFIKADKRWFVPGKTGFKTFDTPLGQLGFFVCADGRIPESARCLALEGAEILVNPTNWGAPDQYLFHVPTRAVENHCWVIGATKPRRPLTQSQEMLAYNRFTGCSFIMSPLGEVLVQAGPDEETIIYAEIEPGLAADKSFGETNNLMADRRPDLYGVLAEPYEKTPLSATMEESIVPDRMVRQIAAVQVSAPGEPGDILAAAIAQCTEARINHGVDLAVLPEHFLFDRAAMTRDPMRAVQISVEALPQLMSLCADMDMWLIAHMLEEERGHVFSTAHCISPKGLAGKYRATHLWDRERDWATPGADIPVFPTPFGNIGIMIGYEGLIHAVARVLALRGADLIAWPTSWRSPSEYKYIAHERAMENRVVIIAANRQDSEVVGPSLLIAPAGYPQNTLASELPHGVRGFVTRFAQLSASRSKRETNNTDLLLHRRPDLYMRLVAPVASNL